MVDYRQMAAEIARRYNIPVDLFLAQINQESSFNPAAVSPAGAIGLGQIMPGTAKELGVDPTDPMQNLEGSARYLSQQYNKFGDWGTALAAYNAGPGAVSKYGGIPPYKETQNYVRTILGNVGRGTEVAADTMAALGKGGGAVTPDQIAQAAQAQSTGMQEEQQPRGLLGGLLGNPDMMANLALAFNSMRLNPDQNLATVLSSQMKERRAERKEQSQLNKTVAMLESIGADPRLIELAKAGYAKEAIAQAYKAPKDEQIIEVDGRLVKYDPKTGETTQVYGPQAGSDTLSKDQMSTLNSLRDDLRTELKPFEIVKQGYNNITEFYNNPNATGDYALAVSFAKILDPGSVAREGEVAAVQNAGARIPALGQALKNAITGEGQLTQEVRQQIAELATAIYKERAQEAGNIISGYGEIARRGNVPAELLYSGNIPEARKVIPAIVPPAAQRQGVTQQMWDMATPEEKQAWMN